MTSTVLADLFLGPNNIAASSVTDLRQRILEETPRIRAQGSWPACISDETLVTRMPGMFEPAPGFDAGMACALDLIPHNKQALSSKLHAAYTEAAVEQVRREAKNLKPDSEACWWLAASFICKEGVVDIRAFVDQLSDFEELVKSPSLRLTSAMKALNEMRQGFKVLGGIPFVIKDGGLQGAYISGYDWGVQYVEAEGLFYVGTFRESLGLEDFRFSKQVDEQGRAMSGPVHGSHQFVKTCSIQELENATFMVHALLGPPKK